MSQDPVAIDSVGADFLMNEPAVTNSNAGLLHEAGLVKNAPSGIAYQNGSGKKVSNLGVHEHWNNPVDRKYSRNRGKKGGDWADTDLALNWCDYSCSYGMRQTAHSVRT